jgi:hypothetical protein
LNDVRASLTGGFQEQRVESAAIDQNRSGS